VAGAVEDLGEKDGKSLENHGENGRIMRKIYGKNDDIMGYRFQNHGKTLGKKTNKHMIQ
jgi:hypothetical protein